MFVVGPTLFSGNGDHPAGDGLTRFQCAFAGASSADVSAYATGSGSVNGGTLGAGTYTINLDGVSTLNRYILWNHASNFDLSTGGTLTAEFFVTLSQDSGVNPAAATKFAQLSFGGTNNAIDFYVNGLSGGFNKLSLLRNASVNVHLGSGNAWGTHHFAITFSPDGYMRVYVDGVRTYEDLYTSDGSDGAVQLGGVSTGFTSRYIAEFTGARVRRAIMYSGTPVAVPGSAAAWGSP